MGSMDQCWPWNSSHLRPSKRKRGVNVRGPCVPDSLYTLLENITTCRRQFIYCVHPIKRILKGYWSALRFFLLSNCPFLELACRITGHRREVACSTGSPVMAPGAMKRCSGVRDSKFEPRIFGFYHWSSQKARSLFSGLGKILRRYKAFKKYLYWFRLGKLICRRP